MAIVFQIYTVVWIFVLGVRNSRWEFLNSHWELDELSARNLELPPGIGVFLGENFKILGGNFYKVTW